MCCRDCSRGDASAGVVPGLVCPRGNVPPGEMSLGEMSLGEMSRTKHIVDNRKETTKNRKNIKELRYKSTIFGKYHE
jgi:hypothetical protein